MKKFISNIKTLAALLMAVAALAACSNEDVSVNEQLVVNPTETAPKTYTMTIQATKSSGDDAATISYPVQVYVFQGEECKAMQTIGDEGQTLNIALVEGAYSVYAVGGASGVSLILCAVPVIVLTFYSCCFQRYCFVVRCVASTGAVVFQQFHGLTQTDPCAHGVRNRWILVLNDA